MVPDVDAVDIVVTVDMLLRAGCPARVNFRLVADSRTNLCSLTRADPGFRPPTMRLLAGAAPEHTCAGLAMKPVNVICMKYFTRYGPHYVNRLHRAVQRHLSHPFRFVCFTEDPAGIDPGIETPPLPPLQVPKEFYPSAWLKLAFFQNGLAELQGPTLFLDLDLVILGSLDDFFDYEPDRICIIHNWIEFHKTIFRPRPDIGNSSVFRFNAGASQFVLDSFNRETLHALHDFPTEQAYLTKAMGDQRAWWPEEWVRSFKRNCLPPFPLNLLQTPRVPRGTRIVAFHGRPDPDEALVGYKGKLHKSSRPAPWIKDHWH